MRRKPISQPFTFEVERYAATDQYYDPLQNGTELMLPLLLMVSPFQGEFWGYSRRTFAFSGCTVIGKEYGTLDAERGALLTEVIKIAYRQVAVIDIPETIAAERNNYSKNFAIGQTITETTLKKEEYGRQVSDPAYSTMLGENITNKNAAAFIKEGEHFTGSLDPTRAFSTFNYLTGEAGTKEKEAENARSYKVGYGDFSGDKSADSITYLEGEMGAAPDANKRAYKTAYGDFSGDTSADVNTYLEGEMGTAPDANAAEYKFKAGGDAAGGNNEQVRGYTDAAYETLLEGNTTNKNAAAYVFKNGTEGNTEQVRANATFDYVKGEVGSKPDANKRSYPDDESYYGKEIAEKYENGAKDNSRAWPDTESYYGKDIAEKYESTAKDNSRAWPDKESYYGKDIAKNYESNAKDNSRTWPDTESYYGKEIAESFACGAKDNSREWPGQESYYGKEIAEKYKSSAKNNERSWPKTASYYGKETLERIAKNAKSNGRKWPPTESAFGIEQMKNKGKK